MAEDQSSPPPEEITENDKLMAALAYPIPLIAIVILLVQEMKDRPFQKYHAVQSLGFNIVLWVVMVVSGLIFGVIFRNVGCLCGPSVSILWFALRFRFSPSF